MTLKSKLIFAGALFVLGSILSFAVASFMHFALSGIAFRPDARFILMAIKSIVGGGRHLTLFLLLEALLAMLIVYIAVTGKKHYKSKLIKVTDDIYVPAPAGQFQHGSAWFLGEAEYDREFGCCYSDEAPADGGGIVVAMKKMADGRDKIWYFAGDIHTILFGKTGSGKTRRIFLETIVLLALAGQSMVVSDPKGEMYAFTRPLLEKLGYEVPAIDFKSPEKSHCQNLLQSAIDAHRRGERGKLERYAWDLTTALVGEPGATQEKIWHNGEMSIIAAGIICVVVENKMTPELQNLTNVYHFINEMCKPIGGKLPLTLYVKSLPHDHPAKPLIGISEVAPQRTRGSFYTSALTTLRLFTTEDIYSMTHKCDFGLVDVGKKKQALFIIVPDQKTTYYPIASLLVSQQYELLIEEADRRGGVLTCPVNYVLEEFGNFTNIPDFMSKLTAGRSRGIRFYLSVQGSGQLDEKYGDDAAKTIKGNCNWLFLQAKDTETLKEISEKMDTYTTRSYSLTNSQARYQNPQSSESVNLSERDLLTPGEVGRIRSPYALVFGDGLPAVTHLPDLSEWVYNGYLGLGDREHNSKVWMEREQERPIRNDINQSIRLWFNLWLRWQSEAKREAMEEQLAMSKKKQKEGFMYEKDVSDDD
jgi:type IV secretion system protein VirD4